MKTLRFAIVAALLFVGCAKPPAVVHGPYLGPTDRLDVVLARINANNSKISTLNAGGRFQAWIGTEDGERYVNGRIKLIHTKPDKVRLIAERPEQTVFDVGTDGDQFWFHSPIAGQLFYGHVGRARQDARLPISPTLLVDVLGVATLETDLLAQPTPMMRFNPDYDAYMITWARPMVDRWVVQREVWYDRATLEPRRVWLFDGDGRVVLRAILSDFRPFNAAPPEAPKTPRVMDLFFPESRSRLELTLDDVRATVGKFPNKLSYRFSAENAPARQKVDLDEGKPAR